MKRYRYLFLFLLVLKLNCDMSRAQSLAIIDSLKHVLIATTSDSGKMKIYANISWNYAITRTKLDTARLYADSVKLLSTQQNNKYGMALAHFYHGVIDRFAGNFYQGLRHLKKYVDYCQQVGDSIKMEAGLFQMGVIQSHLGNYSQSLTIYHRLLAIYQGNDMQNSIGSTLHSIGHIQRKLNKQGEAIKSYKKAITIKKQVGDVIGLAMSTESLGNTYGELEQYDSAEFYLQKALSIAREEKITYLIASGTENLGNLNNRMGNYQNALNYHLEAHQIYESLPSKKDLAYSFNKLGNTYVKLGIMDKAQMYLFKSLDLSKAMNVKPILMDNYKVLMDISKSKNEFKSALEYQNLYTAIKDSIFNTEKVKQLTELETKYETAAKDQEIGLLTKEKEIQEKETQRLATLKNAMVGGLILTILLAGLLYYIFRQKIKNQKILSLKNAQITEVNFKQQLSELEMKALRAQMNPHFVFNCLNSINRMILSGDIKDASGYLTKFSRLIRKVLENSEKNMVSLADELTMLKAYIQLETLRFKGKISFTTEIDKNINLDAAYIPSMVLQPLIENAIWHGLMHKDKGGTILLTIVKEENVLKCSVEDNGVGREKNLVLKNKTIVKHKSMGLQLTSERLKIMGQLGLKRFIEIVDLKDDNNQAAGTRVDLLIPIAS